MFDPREIPAFWGLCGGVLSGVVDLVTAYSAKAGTPEARNRAWLHLALGMVVGPILAEAGVPLFHAIAPLLPMEMVGLTMGWIGGNDPREFFNAFKKFLLRNLKEET